jgi:hypothetical protein
VPKTSTFVMLYMFLSLSSVYSAGTLIWYINEKIIIGKELKIPVALIEERSYPFWNPSEIEA